MLGELLKPNHCLLFIHENCNLLSDFGTKIIYFFTEYLVIAGGGAGQVPYNSGADTTAFLASGTSGQVLQSNGTSAPTWVTPNNLTSDTAKASTSGTSIDFTGIPSTVSRIQILLSGVSTSGTSALLIQIGDSGGIEATGYLGASSWGNAAASNSTAGLLVSFGGSDAAAAIRHGSIIISKVTGNSWVLSGNVGLSNVASMNNSASSKSLSDVLTQLRITTVNGTDTFDAGSINIMYE